ncbi:hypothetical protein [Burkholderia territorii]|uniref:hypothetical protein n=1 Tax=Burkholderia territorii TaxID=1503055 RepID=UPI00075B57AF|nr:hypothetical protein [Burkholderia territorii]KWE31798.1 hypothetical protein WT50_30100 [Burkholderia territorii]KWE33638.1 hypothetical protein WT49_17695 [Burkholderia territorii]KWE38882.1 hypothetical protein WT51_30455 [Burkholderia territorii]KWO67323.1 hypothetical protein WT98_02525 [Burkholderia territorii]
MARDIYKRLKSLDARRRGTDRTGTIFDSAEQVVAKSAALESYQQRGAEKEFTKYALGSMQAVDPDYTRIGVQEATRIGQQLKTGLAKDGIGVEFRLQGSVPCDIHIRGASDVDLLVLEERYFHYDRTGPKAQRGEYGGPVPYDTLDALRSLRTRSEKILTDTYYAATVDTTGAKAIHLSGGSLRRDVDVVPSNWFDTVDYQKTGIEADRGVDILDKSVPARVRNMPFRHIQRITNRDRECGGGLKKAIRLCKNIKADAIDEGTAIRLSSFDIASMLWHADIRALTVGVAYELAILAEATRFLDYLSRNHAEAKKLYVPDGSRIVFDTAEKLEALNMLSLELDDLSLKVSREQAPFLGQGQVPLQQVNEALRRAYIPA